MKTLAFLLLICVSAKAQLTVDRKNLEVTLKTNLSPTYAFEALNNMMPKRLFFYDRYVITKTGTYYQPSIFFARKKKAYLVVGNDIKKVRIW